MESALRPAASSPRRVLRDGRLLVVAALAAYFGVVAALALFRDGIEDWALLGVPPLPEPFGDMRSLTSAWECASRGVEVVPENPCDPLGRPANYPSLWLLPGELGLDGRATVALGVANAAVFLAAVFAAIGPITWREGILYAAVLTSPPVMLGIERGNVDLLLCALLVLAIALLRAGLAGRLTGYALVVLAAALKLFPAFALAVAARLPLRAALLAAGAAVVGLSAYAAARYDELRAVIEAVPRFTDLSYGIPVALQVVRDQHGVLQGSGSETLVHLLAALAAVGAGAALALARGRRNPVQRSERETFDVDALWVGACVFVGSFLTIGNWNYRLVFLVLVVPALLRWRHGPAPLPFATAALGVLVASLWLSAPVPVVPLGPSGVVPLWDAFAWDELLYWLLAAYLVAALSVTTALTGEKRAIRGAA